MPPLEELIEHILNSEAIDHIYKKRMYCPHCDKTWIELVGHIIRRRQKGEDVHLRIGSDSPCHCIDCGCEDVFEVSLPIEIEGCSTYREMCGHNAVKLLEEGHW